MIYKLTPFTKMNTSLDLLASALLEKNSLYLNYKLTGDLSKIKIPKQLEHKREIGLWESTCFEFFFLNEEDHSYYEFNFSPSGKWNCFFFNKQGDQLKETECNVLNFNCNREDNFFELQIEIDMNSLKESFRNLDEFKMNLTTVIEADDLSYWALDHGKEKPNFHDFKYFRKNKKVR